MAKFLMLGKYSTEALKGISAERTKAAVKTVEQAGGKLNSVYALLGGYDLAIVAEFPGNGEAIEALTKLTGVGFTTLPALAVEEFDRLVV